MKKNFHVVLLCLLLCGCSQASQLQNVQTEQSQQSQATQSSEQIVQNSLDQCFEENGLQAFSCFETYLKEKVKEGGPEMAFTELKKLYDQSATIKAYCHPLAHSIGHEAVEKYPTISEAFKHGDPFCWSGYYHGVMEQYAKNLGTDKWQASINDICKDIPGKEHYSFDYYNCVHGMGHGVMELEADNLFDSLKMCDKLNGQWEKESCYGGVFMENVIIDNEGRHSDYLKPDQPLYPCTAVADQYKESCYLMQTSYMLKNNGYDFDATFKLCEQADKGFHETCFQSLGRDASGSSVSDVQKTHDICMRGLTFEERSNCMIGAVKDFISYYHSDVQAKQFCNSFDEGSKTEGHTVAALCLSITQQYYKTF